MMHIILSRQNTRGMYTGKPIIIIVCLNTLVTISINDMEKKLFYVVNDGESSITVPAKDLEDTLKFGLAEHNENMTEEDLPVFTVSPIYMTKEEYNNMPEYNG